jgi:DNA-binding transcriptional LysR family regulator
MVELRRLKQLLVLAEELNFHRAAERLHMSQPALSRPIRNLELEVGATLVERTTRAVELTDAGRELVERSRPLMEDLSNVVEDAQRRAGVRRTLLRVGFKAGATGRVMTPVLKAFERQHPEVEVVVRRLGWADQEPALLERRVDVAFLVPTEALDDRLSARELLRENRVVGLPLGHRLAAREEISISELSDDPIPVSRSVPESVTRWWSAIPRADGPQPPIGPSVDSVEEMLEVVAMGRAICLVSRSVEEYYGRPDVVFVPVVDVPLVPVTLVWRTEDARAVLRAFQDVAVEVVAGVPA